MKSRIRFSLLLLFLFLGSATARAQKITNVHFIPKGNKIQIFYDLQGKKNQKYNVRLFLKKEDLPKLKIEPKFVTGDIGEGKFAGKNRLIIWYISKQFKNTRLPGSDYYFVVTATPEKSKSHWGIFLSGVTFAGGAAAAVLLNANKKKGGGNKGPVIAQPPDRPNH